MSKFKCDKKNGRSGKMKIYRNVNESRLGGVCAGFADHLGISHFFARAGFIVGLFSPISWLLCIAYIICWFLLDPMPEHRKEKVDVEYDENIRSYRPKTVFSKTESSSIRIARAKDRLARARKRVEALEEFVTSKKYQMQKEFSKMEKE